MKTSSQKQKLAVDISLFILFISTFFLDLTGLPLHQWIGVIAGAIMAYHLLTHFAWIKCVTRRFFNGTSGQARLFYGVDSLLLAGMLAILFTGIIMSTWLNLALPNYDAWHTLHVVVSIATLLVLMVKIGLHASWFQRVLSRPLVAPATPAAVVVAPRSPAAGAQGVSRRDFVKMMGIASVVSLVALSRAVDSLRAEAAQVVLANSETSALPTAAPTQASATATSQPTARAAALQSTTAPTATPTATQVPVAACVVRCPRGCSFPGHCRRYTDANGNGRCDLGECL